MCYIIGVRKKERTERIAIMYEYTKIARRISRNLPSYIHIYYDAEQMSYNMYCGNSKSNAVFIGF